ncbi:uncharacterized protein SPPG_05825 [Spizellomyces punctatus DAOM BR117]|uniref:Uncharacterized protein n=1 Tax=Spizellomyces punctatus (strain DAOM BR117) TaxID=645134 RepID=A0A0L0HD21_SPIPD|nr:uncharacterized protein SPPG_05825 [Spizellomyces punctatus DAOM BR117]KNC98854.1 hypothetical protein SPPG_05825 [Spizellomyces punctatus DAOM BR117]|eukprot:XP_016606894.1 hypothetical protein SPPG_05825 [Spizellomyces punctatus DAOM BR117]
MPTIQVPKPLTEPIRPQRRHYLDIQPVYDYEPTKGVAPTSHTGRRIKIKCHDAKILHTDAVSPTGVSTYRSDYRDVVDSIKVPRLPSARMPLDLVASDDMRWAHRRVDRNETIWDPPKKSEKQNELDRMTYMSTYQNACNETQVGLPPIQVDRSMSKSPSGGVHSVYQDSYHHPQSVNANLCRIITNPWGKTNLLNVPQTRGVGVRNLLHGDSRPASRKSTSYAAHYQIWPSLEPPQSRSTFSWKDIYSN